MPELCLILDRSFDRSIQYIVNEAIPMIIPIIPIIPTTFIIPIIIISPKLFSTTVRVVYDILYGGNSFILLDLRTFQGTNKAFNGINQAKKSIGTLAVAPSHTYSKLCNPSFFPFQTQRKSHMSAEISCLQR
ncbi:hypothetical protein VN97_g11170 [Penicillium thymicola]|uniref:Uncharacterized protein n=1 Tax=Penicillium thymicola TaxID=293382 RepID=A0AAI9T7T8_PENTH|nr:hypothetical protein VN97_g11170 [Penicillium thymicola]